MDRVRMIELQKSRSEEQNYLTRLQWMIDMGAPYADAAKATARHIVEIDRQIEEAADVKF